jgi:glucokinase
MIMRNRVIGVDIGGTKMHFALIDDGKILRESRISTDAYGTKEAVMDDLKKGIGDLLDGSVQGIGIGVPGLVDTKLGVVYNVLNIPAWKNVPIKAELEKIYNIPVYVGNDANCFALGEKYYGKAKPFSDVVCLTLGTGLGAGIFINDRLYAGNYSMAGEFCGIKYLDADLETYCSGKFFSQMHGQEALFFFRLAEKGDSGALALFRQFGFHVGQLIQTVLLSYAPQAIIFGGSLSKSFSYFKDGMQASLSTFAHQNVLKSTLIDVSEIAAIPVLGASALIGLK